MKTITRTALAVAFAALWAVPATPQSANRTGPPTPAPQGPVTAGPAESQQVRTCRLHCDSLDATSQRPQRSVVEKAARKDACAKKMVS